MKEHSDKAVKGRSPAGDLTYLLLRKLNQHETIGYTVGSPFDALIFGYSGCKQSHLGTETHRERALAEDRNSNLAANRSPLPSGWPGTSAGSLPTLDDVRPQSRQVHSRHRLPGDRNGDIRLVYVLIIIMEVGTRRIVHFNVTQHPTAEWTLQQFRECVTGDEGYRSIIHDRDSIYSREFDSSLRALGLEPLRTLYRSPQANTFCERLIGTVRRECLNFMIAITEAHIRQILKAWVPHHNKGRPHSRLGPGIPDPGFRKAALKDQRHRIPVNCQIISKPILGGLHHEYGVEEIAA